MGGRHMPPKHLAFPAAVQADDVIVVNGSANRNRRGSLDDGFCRRFTESREGLMDGRNQGGELIRRDLMASEIRADDLRREAALRGRILIGHLVRPSHLFDRHAQQPKAADDGHSARKTGVVAWKLGPLLRTLHPPVAPTRLAGPFASLAASQVGLPSRVPQTLRIRPGR
jgi:hypothetical protein